MYTFQGKKQTFSCEVCTSSFSHKSDLNKHMKTHTAPESFSCEVCGKLFNYKNSLRRHEKIHKNERLHSCDICDQNFIQKCDLQVNIHYTSLLFCPCYPIFKTSCVVFTFSINKILWEYLEFWTTLEYSFFYCRVTLADFYQ